MVTIDEPTIQAVVEALIALLLAVYAWYKHQQAGAAQAAIKATEAAYTPGTPESQDPAVVVTLPVRSWKMDPATLEWCTFDATPENKATIIAQIKEAEDQHLTQYQIHFNGGYYIIEYGLLKGGAGNPSGKKTN